jgi:homoserine O-acetyltransferase
MSAFALSPETQRFRLGRPFQLESGATLDDLEIAYRTWGRLSPTADNAVVVCHALTGSADADRWWAPLFGVGRALDPERDFIVCSNVLGGCYGTTGPATRDAVGRRLGTRFPKVTIRDQVRAQIALVDALGIRGIRLVIGGSMGGLQALEWPLLDNRVGAVATIAASGRHSAWCIAWSEAQRLALAADPRFRGGDYADDAYPEAGLAAARAIAMLTYRTARSLDTRFGRHLGGLVFGERATRPDAPAVVNWLAYHGAALVARFDPLSYWRLLEAMDSHDLGRGRGSYREVARRIQQPVLVVSIPTDTLYVPAEQVELAELLPDAELVELDSEHGHDGFLIDAGRLEPIVRAFRTGRDVARAAA